MAVSEGDRERWDRQVAALAEAEVHEAAADGATFEDDPPELELHRRAVRLGLVRHRP